MRMLKLLLCGLLLAMPVWANETEDRQTATSLKYVTHELDTRQDKLEMGANVAIEYTDSAGDVAQRTVKTDLASGSTSDTSLPTVSAVTTGLNTKQDSIAPINDHTAVTYTGQTGGISTKGIYQTSGTYAEQSDDLIDAKTFNAALKNGLDNEFVCDEDNKQPGTGRCWLWKIHNPTENKSPNLFDKTNNSLIFRNRSLDNAHDGYWWYNAGSKSFACPCAPNTTYTISGFSSGGSIYRVATIDIDALPTNDDQNQIPYSFIYRDTTKPESYTFTTPATAKWIVVQINSGIFDNTLNTIQIEKGSTATPYQPYNANVYIPENR